MSSQIAWLLLGGGRKRGESRVKCCWGQSKETRLRLFGNRKTEKLKQLILLCSIANRAPMSWERIVGAGEGTRAAFHKAANAAVFQQKVILGSSCMIKCCSTSTIKQNTCKIGVPICSICRSLLLSVLHASCFQCSTSQGLYSLERINVLQQSKQIDSSRPLVFLGIFYLLLNVGHWFWQTWTRFL